ncbi:hypothetical protein [Pseudorhodobacter antarcticus]|uniref:hypothetical protein n=1 Tax=Pseudorhodobacter antarcticus TaxID=1077947 RepID=UPI00067B984D|nr:hypothetical protein [Pseudorhodobacter antarcticus]
MKSVFSRAETSAILSQKRHRLRQRAIKGPLAACFLINAQKSEKQGAVSNGSLDIETVRMSDGEQLTDWFAQ